MLTASNKPIPTWCPYCWTEIRAGQVVQTIGGPTTYHGMCAAVIEGVKNPLNVPGYWTGALVEEET